MNFLQNIKNFIQKSKYHLSQLTNLISLIGREKVLNLYKPKKIQKKRLTEYLWAKMES